MPRSKSSRRRTLARLKGQMGVAPWAIDARVYHGLQAAIAGEDLAAVKASLSYGATDEAQYKLHSGVAIIPVTGVLREENDFMVRWGMASSYQVIDRQFVKSLDDSEAKAIVFYMASPGGSAIGCKRLADRIFAARGGKPIVAYTQQMAGSACFYLAAACDRIEATADAMVASVGTIYTHAEYSGAFKEFGQANRVFTNAQSPKKGHGNPYEPLSEASAKTLQEFVDSYGDAFVADVALYRNATPEEVAANYGQGDSMRADIALTRGVIDGVVGGLDEVIAKLSEGDSAGAVAPAQQTQSIVPSAVTAATLSGESVMNERIKAQLFALGLIDSVTASDAESQAALKAFCAGRGKTLPGAADQRLALLQSSPKSEETTKEPDDEDEEEDDDEATSKAKAKSRTRQADDLNAAHDREQAEARLADLLASAKLLNKGLGYEAITGDMVLNAHEAKQTSAKAVEAWNENLAQNESPIPANRVRVTGEGASQFVTDAVDALVYRSLDNSGMELSDGASGLLNMPLWAVAGKCLEMSSGHDVDMYGDPETIAEQAMQMGAASHRHTFYSSNEDRRYVSNASAGPAARPGDFPNLLSTLANKFFDTVQLDDDYSFPEISAVLPGGLRDFKPGLMGNVGVVEEMDEVRDGEKFKELGLKEEVLSSIHLRRFGNKWGWTPVLMANDDLNAFAEGMLGLLEAWMVTQNRLVLDRYTANEQLLDGNALFADRPDVKTAKNNNDITAGSAISDASWGEMENAYADIGGIDTGRRVRGALNVALVPTGQVYQDARRTFMPLNAGGLEAKVANTTDQVGLYRGQVKVVAESELRMSNAARWFGLRNPTRLNTATVVRGYFNGYGTAGRRERWYDPESKTTYVSLEGRMAAAVKNWRYSVRNAGAA